MDDLLSIAVSNAVAATVLALAAVAVGAVYRRPAVVHGLWLLVLLKLVTPPLLRIPIAWPVVAEPETPNLTAVREELPAVEEPATILAAEPADEGEARRAGLRQRPESDSPERDSLNDALGALTQPRSPAPSEPLLWPQMLQILWGVGSLAWFLLALERLQRFRRLLRFARPAPAALQERGRRLAQSLALPRCPRIRLLPGRIAPMLWAVGGAPRLLVPADLLDVLSDEQLDTLLMHELAHLRRRDHWVRVLEFVVMGLYWWHPVVWYARRELREAEEQCCDAWVVSTLAGAGRTYASALLDTLDFLSTAQAAVPPLASGLSHVADLKRRLTMIMRGTTPRSLSWPGCLAVITAGLTFLPMLPALHGQQAYPEEAIKSEADVKEAKAELEVEKALLEQQKAKIAHAEEQLKKAAAAMEKQRTMEQLKKATRLSIQNRRTTLEEAEWERKSLGKVCIEVVVNVEDVNLSELGKKLKEVFPQKSAHIIVQMNGNRFFQSFPKKAQTPPGTPSAPPAPPMPPNSPPSRQDKRINDLEKKLEKVLRELQELRKQMKEPRSGFSPPPSRDRMPNRIVPAPEESRQPLRSSPGDPYYAPTVPLTPNQRPKER